MSVLAGKYYAANVSSDAEFPELQKQLSETDQSLSGIYQGIFSSIVDEIAKMSYNPKEAELSVLSTLSEKRFFRIILLLNISIRIRCFRRIIMDLVI